jgi:hypothetical protein
VNVPLDERQRKLLQSESKFFKKDAKEWAEGRIRGALRHGI